MKVTEKDLFMYIYNPDTLSAEVFDFIELNRNKFKDELNLLTATKKAQEENVSDEILNKIKEKIKEFENPKVIKLFKYNNNTKNDNDYLVLAAESPALEKVSQTETFKDSDSHYLIKIISNKELNKIFVFNQDNIELKNFTLTLEPSGDSYNVETSSKPFLVKPKQNIDRISLIM